MKSLIIFLVLVTTMLLGCGTMRQANQDVEQPELITMSSLPPATPSFSANGLKLNILFRVLGDGSVVEVKMLGSSGDPDWDRAVIDSLKQWHFAENRFDSQGTGRWIRNTIVLQVQEATVLTLGELTVGSQKEADSLYALLESGSNFETLIKQVPAGSTTAIGRVLGAVDIARYPKHVRDNLRKLAVNDYTHPVRMGSKYTIFKRYKSEVLQDLVP